MCFVDVVAFVLFFWNKKGERKECPGVCGSDGRQGRL